MNKCLLSALKAADDIITLLKNRIEKEKNRRVSPMVKSVNIVGK
jgi:hypothetical protein